MLAAFRQRSWQRRAALIALLGFLFATAAVANYVCPDFAPSAERMAAPVTAPHDTPMPCDNVDAADPQLCVAHCQYGDKSLDMANPLSLLPWIAVLSLLYLTPLLANPRRRFWAEHARPLIRCYEPPLFLRHCRFTQ